MKKENIKKISMICLSLVASSALYAVDVVDKQTNGQKASAQTQEDFSQNKGWFLPNLNLENKYPIGGYVNNGNTYVKDILDGAITAPNFSTFGQTFYLEDGTTLKEYPRRLALHGISYNNTKNVAPNMLLLDGGDWVGKLEQNKAPVTEETFYNDSVYFGGYNDKRAWKQYHITGAWNALGERQFTQLDYHPLNVRVNKFVTEVAPIEVNAVDNKDALAKLTSDKDNLFFRVGFSAKYGLLSSQVNPDGISGDNYTNEQDNVTNFRIMLDDSKAYSGVFGVERNAKLKMDSSSALVVFNKKDNTTKLIGVMSGYKKKGDADNTSLYYTGKELQDLVDVDITKDNVKYVTLDGWQNSQKPGVIISKASKPEDATIKHYVFEKESKKYKEVSVTLTGTKVDQYQAAQIGSSGEETLTKFYGIQTQAATALTPDEEGNKNFIESIPANLEEGLDHLLK